MGKIDAEQTLGGCLADCFLSNSLFADWFFSNTSTFGKSQNMNSINH